MTDQDYKVIMAFMRDSKSHRKIQKEILNLLAPARGGGFEAMTILHNYGVDGALKGTLSGQNLSKEELNKILSKQKVPEDYLPVKEDVEVAFREVSHREENVGDIDAILDEIEQNMFSQGHKPRDNWRLITERNIPIWFA